MKFLLWLLTKFFWKHAWRSSNPHNRYCSVCGRHEVREADNLADGSVGRGYWGAYDEGALSNHYAGIRQWPLARWLVNRQALVKTTH